jgi:hypothetical protein
MLLQPSEFSREGLAAFLERTENWSTHEMKIGGPSPILGWLDMRAPFDRDHPDVAGIKSIVMDHAQ